MKRSGRISIKVISMLLVMLLVIGNIAIAMPKDGVSSLLMIAHAASNGTCGDNLTWTLDDEGTLTISGTGQMSGYTYFTDTPWYNSRSKIKKLVIEEGCTRIGNRAFNQCANLSDVELPDSITYIGSEAFYGCTSLKNIEIPKNITSINYKTFYHCESLPNIVIPEGVTSIGSEAFYYCKSLTQIVIPNGVTSLGSAAFSYCTSLEKITLPIDATYEAAYNSSTSGWSEYMNTFVNSNKIKEIHFTPGRTGKMMDFQNDWSLDPRYYEFSLQAYSRSLKTVIFDEGIKKIGNYAFRLNSAITDVYYCGSEEDWATISIGSSNSYLTNATIHYDWVVEDQNDSESITEADNYIIEEVKKYTSQEMCDLYIAIANSDASYEVKYKVLNEFFENYGLTDVREGTKYLSDTTSHRHSYLYLTTDEIYCAYNFYEWLYTTPKGFAARSALYADGLIFNYEVFSYLDLSTYNENDYPGVKKNKAMLKQFMSYEDPKNAATQALQYANLSADYLENLLDLNDIEVDDSIRELLNNINTSTSSTKTDSYVSQLINDYIMPQIKANTSTDKVYIDGKQFSTALEYAGTTLEFVNATAEDIMLLMNLSNEIAMYQKYEKFLRTIYECTDVSFEMRLAAYSLLDEMENGYMNRVRSILGNFITFGTNMMLVDVNVWKELCGEGGALFGEALATLKLATFISNIIIDTGDFVKQAAYTQGFAELSTLYCLKLKEDKATFLASPTAENAWTFYEDYNILWNLRYQGEEQYLKMNEVKAFIFAKIKLEDYDLKEEIVNDTRAHLLTCRFDLSSDIVVPESVQYVSKTVVNCPVDVEVYAPDGTLITTLKDGIESDITNEYGRFAVVYQPYSGEYAKVICNATDEELKIKAIAIDDGFVDVAFADNSDNLCVYTFDNVEVSTGDVIEFTTNINDSSEYTLDIAGDGSADNTGTFDIHDEEAYVQVNGISTDVTTLNMAIGEIKNIDVVVTPSNATNNFVAWLSSDENIATVNNGTVTAIGAGTTNIYAYSIDNSSLFIEFEVTVTDEITIDASEFVLTPEDTSTIKVDTAVSVTWSTSDSRIATVDENGTVTAHALGTVVITATAGDASASCTIEVVPPISLIAMGGSVRIVEPYGLRFGIQLKKDDAYNQYKDIIVSYGTLIIPKKNLGDTELTFATDKVKDVPAVNIYSEDSTQLTYTGVLVGIPKSSFYSDIVGRGYLKYLDIDGNEKVMYTDEIVRSYYQVANSAYTRYGNMTDRNATEQAVYEKLAALLAEMTDGDNLTT